MNDGSTRRPPLIAAVACLAMAGLLVWAAATGDDRLRVPPLVAYLLAIAPAAAAWRLVELRGAVPGSGDGAATLIFASFALVGAWIAVGSGERVCGVGSGVRVVAARSGLGCRVPFGVGAALCGVVALYAGARWMSKRRAELG